MMIRRQQLEAFQRNALRDSAAATARDIARAFPGAAARMTEPELTALVEEALLRAWEYGFRNPADLRAFAQLAVCVGKKFDQHPPFQEILNGKEEEPSRKLDRIFATATPDDWNAASERE